MSRMDRIGSHATTVKTTDGITRVTYHNTTVFELDRNENLLTLRSGGYQTLTTKARINQACAEFGIKVQVYQEDWTWYVQIGGWETGETLDFKDGMVIDLSK